MSTIFRFFSIRNQFFSLNPGDLLSIYTPTIKYMFMNGVVPLFETNINLNLFEVIIIL